MGKLDLRGIDWMIVGGESGAGASTNEERNGSCPSAISATGGVPFSSKQLGRIRKAKRADVSSRTYEIPKPRPSPNPVAVDCASIAKNRSALHTRGNVFLWSALNTQRRNTLAVKVA